MADLQIHAKLAIAAGAVFIPVCTCSVVLRVYARRLHGIKLGADDWTTIAALVFVIAMGVALITEVGVKQLGYPTRDPSTTVGKPDANIAFWPVEVLQIPALGLVKASFIFLYRRIFTKSAPVKFNRMTWFMLFIIAIWTLAFFFSIVFICGSHFSAYWASTKVEKENCVNTSMLHNAFAISDVVTDVIIIALPLPMIWRLYLSPGRKVGICAIFGLGAVSVSASIVSMVIFIQATSVNYNPNTDFELLCTSGLYWSMIESGLGLCAACLPVQYGLMNSKTLQSIIRSVQSAISLRSLSPHSSGKLPSELSPQPSQVHITSNAEGPAREDNTHEMDPIPGKNEIVVTRGFEHFESNRV